MKYYKKSCLDLVEWQFRYDASYEEFRRFIERCFDRFEFALIEEWGRKGPAVSSEKTLRLTRREMEICDLIKSGLSSLEIARKLNLSIRSVENHRKNIRRKLELTNKNINLVTYLSSS
jgi:DNA-binding CsgD family transcriptional regulator